MVDSGKQSGLPYGRRTPNLRLLLQKSGAARGLSRYGSAVSTFELDSSGRRKNHPAANYTTNRSNRSSYNNWFYHTPQIFRQNKVWPLPRCILFLERFDVGDGSNRDNLLRVNLTNTSHVRSQFPYVVRRLVEATYKGVGPEVVSLDVVKVRRILERGVFPIQIFHPPVFHQFQSDIQHTRIYPRKHMKHKTNLLIFGYP